MNYFDDIRCTQVSRIVSRVDGTRCSSHNFWGIGLMLGSGNVKLISTTGSEKICKMPFLYLIQPNPKATGTSAWGVVDGAERENRWFIMEGTRAEKIIASLSEMVEKESVNRFIYLNSYKELTAIHQKMLHLFRRNLPAQRHRLAVCVEEFVGAIYDARAMARQSSPVFRYAAQAAERISENPGCEYDFQRMAKDFHISYDHFRKCFHQYAGRPLYEFLLEKRLALAENLLRESTDSVKEIAERCGFPRQAEFARFIKLKTGFTPSEIRRQMFESPI